ncbi:MAG: hypothetical protein NC936_02390 [Candidatus Omnitrophica bacterium]|nr:hypothetical protein [Candidatus Omnitrophota bacterium]
MEGIAKKLWFIAFTLAVAVLAVSVAPAQEEGTEGELTEMEWVWAEVVSVDYQNSQIKVNYLDEETLEEKELIFNVDKDTVFENVESLWEIKPQDSVSIDYIVTAEGLNLARKIYVEREGEELSVSEDYLKTEVTSP